ncbi:MAG: M1 family metallopeptidase [Caulobacteraceae bacterium]
MRRKLLTAAAALAVLAGIAACNKPAERAKAPAASATPIPMPAVIAQDIHSFARPAEARVTHVNLDLVADFKTKRLTGTSTLDIVTAPGAKQLVLDTKALDIQGVKDGNDQPLKWTLGAGDKILGQPLIIELKPGVKRVTVAYSTRPTSGALQWLTPEQTAGKKHPYLLSQGESILTRTWVPTQDSPGIRQTYEARIVAPDPLRVVMSAEMLTPNGEKVANGRAFRFRLDKPIPPYLMAIAIGDIAFKAEGARTGVYTEPAMLNRVASELVDLEKLVETAESIYGPYPWGRYDVIVLPPSFPFGGMENPRLTFATPTMIAGDRSLVSLIAHELAHSWSGNLVTNATWNDFWLNEGFTTYFENRIMEKLYGPERAAMLRVLGWRDMLDAIKDAGGMNAPDTRLHLDLRGRDPDAGTTDIAYEKGANFLRTIERIVGRERFDAWLKGYFTRHAFQPMTTELFLTDIRQNLVKGDKALEARLMLDQWVYQPGLPSNAAPPVSDAFKPVDAAIRSFGGGAKAATLPTKGWTTQHWQHFLGGLPAKLTTAQMDDLDRTFGLSGSGNSEIRFAWLTLVVANHYDPAVPSLEAFLTEQGRRKFIAPLFTGLMAQGDWGQPLAKRIYAKARPGYHSVTTGTVDAVVNGKG